MDIALTSFIVSGTGIVGMLAIKRYQIATGRRLFMGRWRTESDYFIKRRISDLKTLLGHFHYFSLSFLFKFIVVKLAILFYRIAKAFRSISIKFLDMAKRHSHIRNKGSVSIFLRHISEHKQKENGLS